MGEKKKTEEKEEENKYEKLNQNRFYGKNVKNQLKFMYRN